MFNINGLIALVEEGAVKPKWETDTSITLQGEGLSFELKKPEWLFGRWQLQEVTDGGWTFGRITLSGISNRDLRRLVKAVRQGGAGASALITQKVEDRINERAAALIKQLGRDKSEMKETDK